MKPAKRLVAAALATVVGAAGMAAVVVAPAIAGSTAKTPTIKLLGTNKGKLLSSGGFVLYRFTHDKGSKNTCVAMKGCPQAWPALTTSGTPHTGQGVNASLLGTTKLPNGKKQVTYAGHPIYRYAFATKGSTSYVGVNAFHGFWYGVNAAGNAVK